MRKLCSFSESKSDGKNEDAFQTCFYPNQSDAILISLADGQGGQSGGKEAAQLAVERAFSAGLKYSPEDLLEDKAWRNIFDQTDEAVYQDKQAGFTTFISLYVGAEKIVGVSVGDSAALIVNSQGTFKVLTERQCKNPPMGSGNAQPTIFSLELKGSWKLLTISDGVWKFVGWQKIVDEALKFRGDTLIENLKALAAGPSGLLPDDFTIVLIEN